jgi:phosphoribosylformylglycinamidine synthase
LPTIDAGLHAAVADLVRSLVTDGAVNGVHDVADGGLLLALGELAVHGGTGFDVAVTSGAALLSEASSRVVLAVAPAELEQVIARAERGGVPAEVIGTAGGDRLVVRGMLGVDLASAVAAWRDRLPAALAGGTAQ